MTFTNKLGLPAAIAEALRRQDEDYDGLGIGYSVSELISPPMLVELRRRFRDMVSEDVSEMAYRLLGTAMHYVIEKASASSSVLFEQRLSVEILGTTVHGKPDSIDVDGWLNDYKCTSVWSFLLGDKPEWEAQLNLYDLLARLNGFKAPSGLRIVAILRDWSNGARMNDPARYPDSPILIREIPRWEPEEQTLYLARRVKEHISVSGRPVEEIPWCTPEERWQDPDRFAVMKGANKRATKVCDSEEEAAAFIAAQTKDGPFRIEKRPSTPTRCLNYCEVCDHCPFGMNARLAEAGSQE